MKNSKFKVGEKAICTKGTNAGKEMKIHAILKSGAYSCSAEGETGKYYEMNDRVLSPIKKNE